MDKATFHETGNTSIRVKEKRGNKKGSRKSKHMVNEIDELAAAMDLLFGEQRRQTDQ